MLTSWTTEALINGCKIPNIDWELVRAISISEFVSDCTLGVSTVRFTVVTSRIKLAIQSRFGGRDPTSSWKMS